MSTLDFLVSNQNLPFIITGCVFLGIVILEILASLAGLSMMSHGDAAIDFHADVNGDGVPDYLESGHLGVMDWVNPGHVPTMALILLFSMTFTVLGYGFQALGLATLGSLPSGAITGPLTLAATMPILNLGSKALGSIFSEDANTAVSCESLTGQLGVVNVGPVGPDLAGVARFTDQWGTDHNLSVFSNGENIAIGESVILLGPHPDKVWAFMVRHI